MSSGVGVERTFPFTSPAIDKIDLHSRGKSRRSRLYYLRKLKGRAARLESTLVQPEEQKKSAKKAENTAQSEEKATEK